MKKELKCVMLVDDDENDNYFHERSIKKTNPDIIVITKTSGFKALKYLKENKDNKEVLPDLIFLDINMPGMNGWEFLEEYSHLDEELQKRLMVIMLTTSESPDNIERAKAWNFVSDYITKPLTKEIMENLIKKIF